MAPSFVSRPRSGDSFRPTTSVNNDDENLVIPNRTSSLHSRIAQPVTSTPKPAQQRVPKTLTYAYVVCGVGREPSQWIRAPQPAQGKIGHMKGSISTFWLPEILGSSPRIEQDNEVARSLHAAMRACFPHDVEICTGATQPHCVHHAFVLQQDPSHTLYGIALRVWSRADEKRAETIRELRKRTEPDHYDHAGETYWIPYCLSFLSRYPLYNLLGDYLRGMWIHWNKATNLFHAEEVSRILSFPAPRLNDLVRIDMKDYSLCYQFPATPNGFQNFAIWPLFSCLSIPNIVGILEAAVSPTRRIIFISHYPAMLTVATESIRFMARVFEWSGLYVPVVHARHARELVQEPGPYILGITAECRTLFTAPSDALVVDLDRNFVLTSSPPNVWTSPQRQKIVNRITYALNGDVAPAGVPRYLRSAYGGGKLIPAGQIIVMRGEVESVQDPGWWNQDAVMKVCDRACEKLGKTSGLRGVFGGQKKKSLMTKVSTRHLNEIVRERNQYSRDAMEAWQDFINLKGRMDMEVSKVTKRNNFLVDELESWKQQFLKFQAFAEQLTKETNDLKVKIEGHKRENRRLNNLIDQHKEDAARLTVRLSGTEKQRDDALEALVLQQEIAEELERERKRNKKDIGAMQHANAVLLRQRDEAQRVVLHLRALIDGQAHHMEHIVKSLDEPSAAVEGASKYGASPRSTSPAATITPNTSVDGSERSREGKTGSQDRNEGEGSPPSAVAKAPGAGSTAGSRKRFSELSLTDVADRHLRDKTDAIAYIIRNISEQCAAAVQGLEFARRVEDVSEDGKAVDQADDNADAPAESRKKHKSQNLSTGSSFSKNGDSDIITNASESEYGDGHSEAASSVGYLLPSSGKRLSTVPPTPDLVHDRSCTSMSTMSDSTAATATTPLRGSLQSQYRSSRGESGNIPEVPTRIVDSSSEAIHVDDDAEELVATRKADLGKQPVVDVATPHNGQDLRRQQYAA